MGAVVGVIVSAVVGVLLAGLGAVTLVQVAGSSARSDSPISAPLVQYGTR
jgi:hypothetical protein